MRSSPARVLLAVLALLACTTTACTPGRHWDVRGRVVGFSDDERRVFIAHENIPGLMPAMTMPFTVAPPASVSGLQVGDEVAFRLHANRDSSWITSIRLLGPDAAPLVLDEGSTYQARAGNERILPGQALPDVQLVDHEGTPFTPARFDGRLLLLTFIYTRCPLPDFCPLMTARFESIQSALLEEQIADVTLLSVSIDPAFDRPEVLRTYASENIETLAYWYFATGDPEEIRRLAGALGLSYTPDGSEVVHTLATALIDKSGRLNALWPGSQWTAEEVMARIRYVRSQSEAAAAVVTGSPNTERSFRD